MNGGTDETTWAVREVYSALAGEAHPAIAAEQDKAHAARIRRIEQRQAHYAARTHPTQ